MTKADTKEVGFWITYWKPLAALAVLVIIVAAVWGSSQSKPVTPPSLKLAQKEGEVLFTGVEFGKYFQQHRAVKAGGKLNLARKGCRDSYRNCAEISIGR